MDWKEISIYTTSDGIEILTGYLMAHGVRGVSVEDSADFERFLGDTEIYWDYVDEKLTESFKDRETCVKFYVADNAQGAETVREIQSGLDEVRGFADGIDMGRLALVIGEGSNEEDWARSWKQYYHAFDIDGALTVCPVWEKSKTDTRSTLYIDPGMAFGTGTHESTRLCLECAVRTVKNGDRVLDIGTGSGILSAAALLLGADTAKATDIDDVAVVKSRENAALNGFDKNRFVAYCGNVLTDTALCDEILSVRYDVVFANIVSDVIKAHAEFIREALKDGGTLITSGIIEERADEVSDALTRAGLTVTERYEKNGWAALVCKKGR